MSKIYACRVGKLEDGSNFDKTFNKPIVENKYDKIRWALNEVSLHKNRVNEINCLIGKGTNIYVVLFPSKPNDYPYAICELNYIKERVLGPLLALDETNDERGWNNVTACGHNDFKYDLKFSKIYLLNKNSFNGIKLKGQTTFSELKDGCKNEELFISITNELKYIKMYVIPIICT